MGASGSGKSTLAHELSIILKDVSVFNMDRYLSQHLKTSKFNHTPKNKNIPYIEGLDPNIWDQVLMNQHLFSLKNSTPVNSPVFDHANRVRIGFSILIPAQFLIIEGAYALENIYSNDIFISIIIDTPFHDRFIRKIIRTKYISLRGDIDESIERYILKTEPSTLYYLNKYKLVADVIVYSLMHPKLEFNDYMIKYRFKSLESVRLVPKKGYGKLHKGELLEVMLNDLADSVRLQYSISNKVVFNLTISKRTFYLMKNYYDIVS